MFKVFYTKSSKDFESDFLKADNFILGLIIFHWFLVSTLSAAFYNTYYLGFSGGGLLVIITLFAYRYYKGKALFRNIAALVLITFSIIAIQQNLGRIEMHFHVFIVLSFLTVYKDIRPVTIAASYIILHHLLFTYLQLNNITIFDVTVYVYNYGCGYDIALIHAFFVIFAWIFLVRVIHTNKMRFSELILYKDKLSGTNKELKRNIETFKKLIDTMADSVIIFDNNQDVINVNQAAKKLFGYTKKEFLTKNKYDLIPKSEYEKVRRESQKEFTKPLELTILTKTGPLQVLAGGRNIIMNGKKVRVATISDLSEVKHKDNLLMQKSKMASMGEMLENIAHQWRQPLSTISTAASGVQMQKEMGILSDEFLNESLDVIVKSSKHLSKTIDDFRDFFKSNREYTTFYVNDVLKKTVELLSSKFKNKEIEIIKECENVEFHGIEGELIQAFMNIMTNSQDALESSGIERKLIFINVKQIDHDAVIKIKDNAGGIDENIIDQIFDPYFTTKHKAQGTGIGLYMTYEIIVKHLGGSIEALNQNFKYDGQNYTGAEFIIKLPLKQL